MRSPEELAREKIDPLLEECGSSLVTYHLSLSFIPTIQRLYSMLRSFLFWYRNTDAARRDQREETGGVFPALNEAYRFAPSLMPCYSGV